MATTRTEYINTYANGVLISSVPYQATVEDPPLDVVAILTEMNSRIVSTATDATQAKAQAQAVALALAAGGGSAGSDLQPIVDQIATEKAYVVSQIAALNQLDLSFETAQANLAAQLTSVQQATAANTSAAAQLQPIVAASAITHATMDARTQEIADDVAAHYAALLALQQDLSTFHSTYSAAVPQLVGVVAQAQSDVATLLGQVSALQGSYTALSGAMDLLTGRVTATESTISAAQMGIAAASQLIVSLQAALAAETSARISSNATLTGNLSAEATTRSQADAAETTARQGADAAEAAARSAKDALLDTKDTALTTADATEASTRATQDTSLAATNTLQDAAIAALQASLPKRVTGVAVPALGLGVPVSVDVTWPSAFANANYMTIFTLRGVPAGLMTITVSAQTTIKATLNIRSAAVLAASTLTIDVEGRP